MKNAKLDGMSLKQLRDLQVRVETAIAARQHQEKLELKNKAAQLAAKAGFSVAELFGQGRKTRGPAGIKYRHPQDASLTWTGRGRRPRWLVKAGGDIERFRVA
ncbi:MAG TPA: H-NS histone family protein [Hyphomicrobiaceae bacterium]|nr:H-NS histone family protein [Hyphomicrobiaceae bacterium]